MTSGMTISKIEKKEKENTLYVKKREKETKKMILL